MSAKRITVAAARAGAEGYVNVLVTLKAVDVDRLDRLVVLFKPISKRVNRSSIVRMAVEALDTAESVSAARAAHPPLPIERASSTFDLGRTRHGDKARDRSRVRERKRRGRMPAAPEVA